MSKRWKCVCGKESPLDAQRCPYCQRPLSMYGKYVTDEQEPNIPYKAYVSEISDEQPEKTKRPTKEPKQVTKKTHSRPEPKAKNRGGAGQTILILLLILVILILAALIVVILDREERREQNPTQPPVLQMMPVQTEPLVTEPPATEPHATEPPATEPPATEPPATEPPVTEPPVTEPPATEPPATEPPVTEPPVTEPEFLPNMLTATINGRKETFYLSYSVLTDYTASATFYAKNPRGESLYRISFDFDKNLFEGTYATNKSIMYADVKISFSKIGDRNIYYSYGSDIKNYRAGTFTISKISDDWMVYDGSFNVTLYANNFEKIEITDAVFNFTLEPAW